jgi:hypothetical protein
MEVKNGVKNGNDVQFDLSDCTLTPGDLVSESGIYEICHADEPRVRVLLLRNTFFSYCKQCGDRVRYKLIKAVPHISEDPDFLEDFEEEDNSSTELTIPNNTIPRQLGLAHGFRFWQQLIQAWAGGSEGGDL